MGRSSIRRIEAVSFAKVNLTLEVGDERADGYHEIDSVVQVIDLSDRLIVETAPAGVIEVAVEEGDAPNGCENLVYKACEAFFRATGVSGGARFGLTKRVPVQAGLGGGSANAAAALAALDRLFGTGLDVSRLSAIAAEVGSDVALFIYGGTVRMRGRGDFIEPLPDAPELIMVIIKPRVGVSTAWAYAELDRVGKHGMQGASEHAELAIRHGDRDGLIASLWNDFDPVVSVAFDEIREAKDLLMRAGARRTVLCL
ncbi:MAG: 4-(cytidine 5'-diphospho)-2-C-methyl-D-erythritol kinase, partial [Armatimonadetes bacterium]|nr:4-(cytidine 5'-diphospho)-2-C-methyl-D-erythritol kinase [Armatimonadota bacterium]